MTDKADPRQDLVARLRGIADDYVPTSKMAVALYGGADRIEALEKELTDLRDKYAGALGRSCALSEQADEQTDRLEALGLDVARHDAGVKALQRVHEADCRALQREMESWQTERNEARACQEAAEQALSEARKALEEIVAITRETRDQVPEDKRLLVVVLDHDLLRINVRAREALSQGAPNAERP
jgi:predicted  nucleic acid-binding Zn-ribbon protein